MGYNPTMSKDEMDTEKKAGLLSAEQGAVAEIVTVRKNTVPGVKWGFGEDSQVDILNIRCRLVEARENAVGRFFDMPPVAVGLDGEGNPDFLNLKSAQNRGRFRKTLLAFYGGTGPDNPGSYPTAAGSLVCPCYLAAEVGEELVGKTAMVDIGFNTAGTYNAFTFRVAS